MVKTVQGITRDAFESMVQEFDSPCEVPAKTWGFEVGRSTVQVSICGWSRRVVVGNSKKKDVVGYLRKLKTASFR